MRFLITIEQQNRRGGSELIQAPPFLQQEHTRHQYDLTADHMLEGVRCLISIVGSFFFLSMVVLRFLCVVRQVKTSLEEGAERSMVACDEQLRAAMEWAEGEGLDLNVFLDVVRVG